MKKNRIVIHMDEWKKERNLSLDEGLGRYAYTEIKDYLYPVSKNLASAEMETKRDLYRLMEDYPHYEHDGVCTFLAVDMSGLTPDFPDPVLVNVKAKIDWGFSFDMLYRTANYNLSKHQLSLRPVPGTESPYIYLLDTYQETVPNYLCSCIFQAPFQVSLYRALGRPYYILPLFCSASFIIPVLEGDRISPQLLHDLADQIRRTDGSHPDLWLNHFYFFEGEGLKEIF